MYGLPLYLYLTGVFFVDAGHYLYQRGLSRSVFTHKTVNLALSECKVHVVQSPDPWERFAYALHFEHILCLQLILSRRTVTNRGAAHRSSGHRTARASHGISDQKEVTL